MTIEPGKELRDQFVDAINNGLKRVPGLHWLAKSVAAHILRRLPRRSDHAPQRPAAVVLSNNLTVIPKRRAEFAACTIIAKSNLSSARVLAESLSRFHPGAPFFVLVLDPAEGYFDPAQEPFDLMEAPQLAVPNLEGLLLKYSLVEAGAALKPYLLQHLFEQHEVGKLIYLDPDTLITNALNGVIDMLNEKSIVLTPHFISGPTTGFLARELNILGRGSFNLGFLGLRESETTRRLLSWWQSRVYHHALCAVEEGMFLDQKWMDLAAALFEDLKILKEPGYNVGYWNLHERQVRFRDGMWWVNGEPCYSFRFNGFNPARPEVVSDQQDDLSMTGIGEARGLFECYCKSLSSKGWEHTHFWPYRYDYYESGASIPKAVRRRFWRMGPHARVRNCQPARPKPNFPSGLNVIGYLQSEKGVGEAMRATIRSISAAGISHVINNFADAGSKNVESGLRFSSDQPYAINLICVNTDQVRYFAQRKKKYFRNRYNIGVWNWELSWFPRKWLGNFDYFDEIWAPSSFVRDSLLSVSPIPVIRVPYSIEPEPECSAAWTRSRLGLPEEVFLFYFSFDFQSFLERKNPLGLIQAFKMAFGARQDVALLIKYSHGEAAPSSLNLLQNASSATNIRLVGEVLPRAEVRALMALCDCYVSLHRSEGFGLTLSEAMSFCKPVIATAYSSNTDFMDSRNSFPVRYRLVEIKEDHGPYEKGRLWADPDLEHAAELMSYVLQHRPEATAVAAKGREAVWSKLHPDVVAELIRKHLISLGLLDADVRLPIGR